MKSLESHCFLSNGISNRCISHLSIKPDPRVQEMLHSITMSKEKEFLKII